jgi:1-acyl-sn-glycerol-3-phosphate acyltransferase
VLKEELKWIPFYGWFCVKFEHILVSRDRASVAIKKLVADAQSRAAQGREVFIFPEGTRRPPGAEPDYKPGYVALYEGLGLPCYPLALNSGLYWPRRSLVRYPGTIIVEILDPIPPGLNRKEFRRELEARLEAASDRLLREAAAAPDAPPLPPSAVARLAELARQGGVAG